MKCQWCEVPNDVLCHVEKFPAYAGVFCEWMRSGTDQEKRAVVHKALNPPPDPPPPPPPREPREGDPIDVPITPQDPNITISTIPLAGDVVESIAKTFGIDRLAKFWERATGLPCRCPERKEFLNRQSEKLIRVWERYKVRRGVHDPEPQFPARSSEASQDRSQAASRSH